MHGSQKLCMLSGQTQAPLPHYTTQERAAGQWAAVHDGKANSRYPEDLPALCVCSV